MPLDNRTCFRVNLRDGLRCRSCARGPEHKATYHRGFGYHHVTPRSDGGPDAVENLVLLCQACHDEHHAGRRPLGFGGQESPGAFACHACDDRLLPEAVPMNCGWYHCPRCNTRVHLFDHFGFEDECE